MNKRPKKHEASRCYRYSDDDNNEPPSFDSICKRLIHKSLVFHQTYPIKARALRDLRYINRHCNNINSDMPYRSRLLHSFLFDPVRPKGENKDQEKIHCFSAGQGCLVSQPPPPFASRGEELPKRMEPEYAEFKGSSGRFTRSIILNVR